MDKLIDFTSYPIKVALKTLLEDKSTKQNIIWATDPPKSLMIDANDKSQITIEQLLYGSEDAIQPRITKALEEQSDRTKKKGEVFTPAWICNKMNNLCDEEWFGEKNIFNIEDGETWKVTPPPIKFETEKSWEKYVDSRRLEITCGEAPYLVSRYNTVTGDYIPPYNRIGILDRKLRVVNENAKDENEWNAWVLRAFQSVYGYEYQGDNLLLARINLLLTYIEYYTEYWRKEPDEKQILKIANTIAWNLWQMDGLTNCVPYGKPYEEFEQISFFKADEKKRETVPCKIYDWRKNNSLLFMTLKKEGI